MLSLRSESGQDEKSEAPQAKVEVAAPATLLSEMKAPELDAPTVRIQAITDGRVVALNRIPSTTITFWDTEKKRCDAKVVMPLPLKEMKESPEGRLVVLDYSGYIHAIDPPKSDAPVLAFQPKQCCYNHSCILCSYIGYDNSLETLPNGDWVATTLYGGVRVNSNVCSEFSPTDPLPFHWITANVQRGIAVCCSSYTMDHGRHDLCCYCCTRAGWNLGSIYALTDNRFMTFYNNGDLLLADLADRSFGNRQVCPGTQLQDRGYQVAVLGSDTFVRVILGALPIQIYEFNLQFNVVLKAEIQSAHPITALTALPSKTGFVIGDEQCHLQFWDLGTRTCVQTLDVSGGAVGRSISSVTSRNDGTVIYVSQGAPDLASAMGVVSYDPETEYANYLQHAMYCGAVLRDLRRASSSEAAPLASAGESADHDQVAREPYFPASIVDLICQKLARGDYGRLFSSMNSRKPPAANASLVSPLQPKMKR